MQIQFGKHKGKTAEQITLSEAGYVHWLLSQPDLGRLAKKVADHIRAHLLPKFDSKPLIWPCTKCGRPATYVTAYNGSDKLLYPWCEECHPSSAGAVPEKLHRVRKYEDALDHVKWNCTGSNPSFCSIVRRLAEMKGAPKRITQAAADKFFK